MFGVVIRGWKTGFDDRDGARMVGDDGGWCATQWVSAE